MSEQTKSPASKPVAASDLSPAGKVSAGTSVGNVGSSPMPHSTSGAGSSGPNAGGAQNPTLASKPIGGTVGTGPSTLSGQGRSPSPGASGHTSQPSPQGGSAGGVADQAKDVAGQAKEMAGQAKEQAKEMAGQAQEKAGEIYEQATDWARDTYEQATDWASGAARRGGKTFNRASGSVRGGVGQGASGVQRYVAENPVMVGLIGLAAGLLIGALLPRTRREDETFGEWSDEVRDQGMRYAHDVAQRGREFVEESFTGDDPRSARHESEFRTRNSMSGQNRH